MNRRGPAPRAILSIAAIAALLASGSSEGVPYVPPPPEPPPPPLPPGLPTTPEDAVSGLPCTLPEPGLPCTLPEPHGPPFYVEPSPLTEAELAEVPDALVWTEDPASTRVDAEEHEAVYEHCTGCLASGEEREECPARGCRMLDGYDPEDVIFVPPALREHVRRIAVSTAAEYDDAAEAYRTLRPVHDSDAEALVELEKLAVVAASGGVGLPEIAYAAAEMRKARERREDAEVRERASAALRDFQRRNAPGPEALIFRGVPAPPPIEVASAMHAAGLEPVGPSGLADGAARASVLQATTTPSGPSSGAFYARSRARTRGPDTVVVPGGAKTRKLGPENPEPGAPSPEMEALVATGRARYHLDQLAVLAEEANGAETLEVLEMIKLDVEAHAEALRPLMDDAIAEIARAAGLSPEGIVHAFETAPSGVAIAKLHEEMQRAVLGADLRDVSRTARKPSPAEAYGAEVSALGEEAERLSPPLRRVAMALGEPGASTRVDVGNAVPASPCRSAGCRTLGDCLCSCKRCRSACALRKSR